MAKKLKYDIVLFGKSLRKATRAAKRKMEKEGKLQSPLGKMRPRQKRKAMAKALKIPFNPKYNNKVFTTKYLLEKDERGYLVLKSELVEA